MTSLKTMKTVELEYTLNGDPVGEVLFNNVAYIPKVHTMDTLIERLEGEREPGLREFSDSDHRGMTYLVCTKCGGYDECDCEGYTTKPSTPPSPL